MKLKRSWILIATVVLLLTFAVSGTIAWIAASTDPVVNTFTPGTVETVIEEEFKENVKSRIQIVNNGSVDVYVRVAIVGNWVKDGKVVEPWSGAIDHDESKWTLIDGYYYYNSALKASQTTEKNKTDNLLKSAYTYDSDDVPVEGAHLEMTVIHQSIQAEPSSVVEGAWGVTISNGTVSKKN